MNRSWIDQIKQSRELFSQYWSARSSKQKWIVIGAFLVIFITISAFIFISSRPEFVPLYTGQLSEREVGDIKAELDKQGYTEYRISQNGTMLDVPKKDAPNLLVNLASNGFPKNNKINYDVFGENLSFGTTDRQFDILEQEAMQNKLAGVLKHVDGIKNAEVILSLPEESVFVRQDQEENASASVMVEVEPGVKLNTQQIQALYTLVSRSVPKLPTENITIMNQYSETLSIQDVNDEDQTLDKFDQQRKVQQNIERDIQQNLQRLLGAILGSDKVFVHTFVKINFDKIKTEEKLVQPTDGKNSGIAISSEKTSKSYTGEGSDPGGVVGTGPEDVPGYVGSDSSGNSSYEESENRVNYEVNRVNNEIIKSPYQIEDITINVGVEPSADDPKKLPPEVKANIQNIVSNTVRTALGHPDLTEEEVNQRITVFPHAFAQNQDIESKSMNWYLIGGLVAGVVLVLGSLIWWLKRRQQKTLSELEEERSFSSPVQEPDYFAEQDMSVESQLKKLLEQRPEDFSKVIRTWLNEEEA